MRQVVINTDEDATNFHPQFVFAISEWLPAPLGVAVSLFTFGLPWPRLEPSQLRAFEY